MLFPSASTFARSRTALSYDRYGDRAGGRVAGRARRIVGNFRSNDRDAVFFSPCEDHSTGALRFPRMYRRRSGCHESDTVSVPPTSLDKAIPNQSNLDLSPGVGELDVVHLTGIRPSTRTSELCPVPQPDESSLQSSSMRVSHACVGDGSSGR